MDVARIVSDSGWARRPRPCRSAGARRGGRTGSRCAGQRLVSYRHSVDPSRPCRQKPATSTMVRVRQGSGGGDSSSPVSWFGVRVAIVGQVSRPPSPTAQHCRSTRRGATADVLPMSSSTSIVNESLESCAILVGIGEDVLASLHLEMPLANNGSHRRIHLFVRVYVL